MKCILEGFVLDDRIFSPRGQLRSDDVDLVASVSYAPDEMW
jgi:hypothetical protein